MSKLIDSSSKKDHFEMSSLREDKISQGLRYSVSIDSPQKKKITLIMYTIQGRETQACDQQT